MWTITRVFPLLIAILAFGLATQTARAQTGIAGSAHDLASGIGSPGDNNEICVYCHTPHGARPQSDIEAPLWNKPDSPAAGTYTTYDSTTIDGDILAVGSVSLACLTCHDGSQAMDTVINAPGGGNFNPAGARMNSITGDGLMTPGVVANLGADLTNDHPIGVQYGGFNSIDPDFLDSADTPGLQVATINSAQRWWVDTSTGVNGTREKTDMILYTRDNTGNAGAAEEPFVECASCHDPHNSTNNTFLRVANASSGVCLACHVK